LESFCQPVALVHRSVDPSWALKVTSRLGVAGCLPLETVNERRPIMATYRAELLWGRKP